jgi:hypothetical protein
MIRRRRRPHQRNPSLSYSNIVVIIGGVGVVYTDYRASYCSGEDDDDAAESAATTMRPPTSNFHLGGIDHPTIGQKSKQRWVLVGSRGL